MGSCPPEDVMERVFARLKIISNTYHPRRKINHPVEYNLVTEVHSIIFVDFIKPIRVEALCIMYTI
jgi:hypothetical protein